MKIIANDYEAKYIMKIIREWTELTQQEFGDSIDITKRSIKNYEQGQRPYSVDLLLKIAQKHKLEIIIRKK